MLPLPAYQSCLEKEDFKDPVTVIVVDTPFSHVSFNQLRNHPSEKRNRSLSAIEVDKCLQALTKTMHTTSKYALASMDILRIYGYPKSSLFLWGKQ